MVNSVESVEPENDISLEGWTVRNGRHAGDYVFDHPRRHVTSS